MLVLGNGKVITRDASCPFIEDGAVAIDGTTISRVGTTQDIRTAYPDAEYIDAKGGLIMPAIMPLSSFSAWRMNSAFSITEALALSMPSLSEIS